MPAPEAGLYPRQEALLPKRLPWQMVSVIDNVAAVGQRQNKRGDQWNAGRLTTS